MRTLFDKLVSPIWTHAVRPKGEEHSDESIPPSPPSM